ncbi:MAG TPA: MATE family efflux transporter [Sphaerochaeta sp.]|nr:MAG: MATE family efflux transporter [Spirochaetes bacterium GWC2_52_13]OHD68528.1 MAG: MATE family efflux transporter [Spirochaetes bacterium GWF2_52_7]PKL21116.1 MAG: MATE family efflux transporter [Spirochaetae bacterium HGW-Spirochaetae-4]HCG63976.1 MATE family efflux transporter [Sphaerochaeta sp.]HCJ94783.1 MATE family efflux transporter [Sphaerochaeta sp.]
MGAFVSKRLTAEENYIRMTETPVSRLISSLAVPTIISMLVTTFYHMADTVFVSRLGTQASGAVGIVFSLMSIIQAIGMTLGLGAGNYIARLLGAKENDKADQVLSTAYFTALGIGLLLLVMGVSFLEPFMRLLGSTDTILPYAMAYGGIILFGAPIMAASFVMNTTLRSEGNARLGMRGMVVGSVLNVVLDPLLIFGFDMGIKGAAIATIFSQSVSFVILLSFFLRGKSTLHLSLANFRWKKWVYKEVVTTGMPAFYRQGMASISMILLNNVAAPFGDSALAAMTIVTRTMQFLGSALIGFGQGFQPVSGFSWGAGRLDRLKAAFRFSLITGVVGFTILGTLGFLFAPTIMRFFIKTDRTVVEIGALAMRLQCVVMPLQAMNIIVAMLFQSIGKAKQASLTALSRQGLFFVPVILTLPKLIGIRGMQLSQPIADLATFAFSLFLVLRFWHTLNKRMAVSSAGVKSRTNP